jgi:hypothetical protein
MPVIDAVAAGVSFGGPMSLQVVLSDSFFFLDSALWFKLLQDDSQEMTPKEITQYLEMSRGNGRKNTRPELMVDIFFKSSIH